MRLSLVTPPAEEPITLVEAKNHLRVGISFAADDSLINGLIVASRQAFERATGRQLITATWKAYLDRFPRWYAEPIVIARPPLQDVSSIIYIDTAGASQTWSSANYTISAHSGPTAERGIVYPAADSLYPYTRHIPNAITITFTAGYGDAASDVPDEIKQALYAWIGHHYENREAVITGTIASVVPGLSFDPWKDMNFG